MDADGFSKQIKLLGEKLTYLNQMDPLTISKELERLGITGSREVASACPLAHWVKQELPAARSASVDTAVAVYFASTDDDIPGFIAIKIDNEQYSNVFGFVQEFDSGHYPELIADSD